jgi:hypothetical protein
VGVKLPAASAISEESDYEINSNETTNASPESTPEQRCAFFEQDYFRGERPLVCKVLVVLF